MNQEDQELLLRDLCARLPYKVKCYANQYKIYGHHCECYGVLEGMRNGYFHLIDRVSVNGGRTYDSDYLQVKPYLRPMSSMTEEEQKVYGGFFWNHHHEWDGSSTCTECVIAESLPKFLEFIYSNHLDYLGLIPKGLAIEAPADMYKTKRFYGPTADI